MVWRNTGGIYERKTLFRMKKKRIKPSLRAYERPLRVTGRDTRAGNRGVKARRPDGGISTVELSDN